MTHNAENGLPEFGGSLGTSAPVDSPKPRAECDNYRPPLTCLTAPSTETGRCDKCQARVLPPAEGCTCGRDTYDGPGKQWLSHAPNCRVLPPEESVPEMLARVAAEEEAHADDTDRPHYRNRVTPPADGGTDD